MDKDVVYIYIYIHTYTYTYTHIYIHNGVFLSHKRNEIMTFAITWMDLGVDILNEISQSENSRYV